MLARDVSAVRVNVERLTPDQLPGYLKSVGWRHPTDEILALFARLFRYIDRIVVCLDVESTVHPRVGLECGFDCHPSREFRRSQFLDYLVEQGLCTPDKAAALQSWPGRTQPTTNTSPWPDHLLVSSLLRPPDQFGLFERFISHIKIDYRPGALLETKGYLGWNHFWLDCASLGEEPTAVHGEEDQSTTADHDTATTRKRSRVPDDLGGAIEAAVDFLLNARNQAGWWRDFGDLMGGSDEWVTAYTGTALGALPGPAAVRGARDSWDLLLAHRNPDGGWGYNAYLPADSDGTAWVLRLMDTLGVGGKDLSGAACSFLEQHTRPDGGIASYLDRDCPYLRKFLHAKSLEGLCTTHACVTAAAAGHRCSTSARNFLRRTQNHDGSWMGYWWKDDEYTTALSAQALSLFSLPGDHARVQKAVDWARQRMDDGGAVLSLAHGKHSPFATALCVQTMVLGSDPSVVKKPLDQALSWLLNRQMSDGSWCASAWMRVPPPDAIDPRAHQEKSHLFLDTASIFTTATVLNALQKTKAYLSGVEGP